MGYEKQNWEDNVSVLSAERLNHMETGIYEAGRYGNIKDIPASGLTIGDPVVFDGTGFVKSSQANYLFNGEDAVKLGVMEYTSDAGDIGYTLYVQSDGTIDTTPTDLPCALILSETQIFVDFNPKFINPKISVADLLRFSAIPGDSGNILLKFKYPAQVDDVMFRVKTSRWAPADDETTGTLIDSISDDDGYNGPNEWYTADVSAIASDGDIVYVKAFPRIGTSFNTTFGKNEVACIVGTQLNAWYFENYDTTPDIGSIGLGSVNAFWAAGAVGDEVAATDGYLTFKNGAADETFNTEGTYYAMWINTLPGIDAAFLGYIGAQQHPYIRVNDGTLYVGKTGGAGAFVGIEMPLTVGRHFIIVAFLGSGNISLYLDGNTIPIETSMGSYTDGVNRLGAADVGGGSANILLMTGAVDQVRRFNGRPDQYTLENLFNEANL